jgi:Tfp pilus assembly protein PilF
VAKVTGFKSFKKMTKILLISILSLLSYISLAQEIDLLILNSDYDKALQIIDSELTKNDAQPTLFLKKGIIQQKKFDFTGAVKSLEKAYQLDSINPTILSEIADANSSLGNYKGALPYLKKLYKSDTTNTVNVLKLVRGLLNLRTYKESYEILKSAYQHDTTNLIINKQLALCATRTGHNDFSISLYRKVINQNPTDLANYTNLVSVYQSKDQDTLAIETLEKGLEVFPDDPILLNRLGEFEYHLQKYAKAIIPYEKYLAKGDSSPDVLKNLGICYYFEKREKEGLYLLEKSFLLNPDFPIVSLYIGLCYKNLKQFDRSIEYMNFAAKAAIPYYLSDIYYNLGIVYGLHREFKPSIEAFKKAYQLDTTKCSVLFEIATTYEEFQKDKTYAIRYYNAFLKAKKEDSPYHRKLTEYAISRKKQLNQAKLHEVKKTEKH